MKQIIFTAIFIFAFCFAAFSQTNKSSCPKITVAFPDEIIIPGKPATFTAKLDEEAERYNVEYVWAVSRGKILRGQGTSKIELLADGEDEGADITVSLTVIGLSKDCANTASAFIGVIDFPEAHPVDEFGRISQGDKKARMDNFFVELQNNPTAEGIIKLQNDNNLMTDIKFLSNYVKFRNFDKTRVSFIIADKNEQRTQLWIIPTGAESPKCEDCLIIKAEDFDKLENLFQPKPATKKRKK